MIEYRDYLEIAEYYIEEAKSASSRHLSTQLERSIVSSILFSWISLECFINNMMIDFSFLPEGAFELSEQAFLLEKELEFSDSGSDAGKFVVSNRKRYRPLENKILFLVGKFGKGTQFDKGAKLWQNFMHMKDIRDQLTHPRKTNDVDISVEDAEGSYLIAKEIIQIVSKKVWGKTANI